MKKRLLQLFLAAAILVSLLPTFTLGVSAEEAQLKTSAEAVAILKKYEGFSAKPYWDYAQWTVGYGTKCPDDKLEYYKTHGITEEEAESLLKVYIAKFENELYKFIDRTGVQLSQQQFDALLLFSYNCGSAWSYSGLLYNAVVSGATGNDLIYAFSRWCNAGGEIKLSLLKRRLRDANLYLNGVYSTANPENFGYVLYDACGGTVSPKVQGYDITVTADFVPEAPKRDGYRFLGWYTQPSGGTKVTKLDGSTKNIRLYAQWEDAKKPAQQQGIAGTVKVGDVLRVRSGPGTGYSVVDRLKNGTRVSILEQKTVGNTVWGRIEKGWVSMDYIVLDKVPESQPPIPAEKPETPAVPESWTGKIKVDARLRIRNSPGTAAKIVGYYYNNDKVTVTEETTVGTVVWGKTDKGWISLQYVIPDTPSQNESTAGETVTGKVAVEDLLRLRKGPGTSYAINGYLKNGEKVTVTQQKKVGTATWGKIEKGWISLDYVVLDKQTVQSVKKTVTADCLRIRSAAGSNHEIVGYLYEGAKVEILETVKVGSVTWGRISGGWISMDYVK